MIDSNRTTPLDIDRPEPGRWRSIAWAVAVHGLLIALLAVGVAWKSRPTTIEAELWSAIPQVAAPAPPAPSQAPPPKPEPVRAAPAKAAPPPEPKLETPKPDIALERQAEREKIERQKIEQEKKLKAEKKQADKLAEAKRAEEQAERDKKLKADADRKQREADKRDQDKRFARELERMTAAAGTPSTGNAAQTSGPRGDPSYAGKIAQVIRGNTTYADSGASIPRAEFVVDLDPSGYVVDLRKTRSSGVAGWDEAVERAIKKSEPFPAQSNGRPPSQITITHCPTC